MENRERFSSRLGFILISAGCAIGLGNVWMIVISVLGLLICSMGLEKGVEKITKPITLFSVRADMDGDGKTSSKKQMQERE